MYKHIFGRQNKVSSGYGYLYDWYVYNTGLIAPTGWHAQTGPECYSLMIYLDPAGGVSNVAGKYLKQIGTEYWTPPNSSALNSVGFNGVGPGIRNQDGSFNDIRSSLQLWSSSVFDGVTDKVFSGISDVLDTFIVPILGNGASTADRRCGLSIRYVKDDSSDPGSVTDYDGNIYKTVSINGQVWTTSNIKVTHLSDGTPIPTVIDDVTWSGLTTIAKCAPQNYEGFV